MPGEHVSLTKSSLAYAKLAATPTDTSWSQAYNAGNLFACLSLTLAETTEDRTVLQNLGKELFNYLEAEFFTLEEKTPEAISKAIQDSTKHIPDTITINFCLAFFKESILYLFLLGSGRVVIKRGEKIGLLLERKEITDREIQTASGYLENNDTIILETSQFAKNISDNHILEALQLSLPNDIAESLSIHMHEKSDGDQAAIIIAYHGTTHHTAETYTPPTQESVEEEEEEEPSQPYTQTHHEAPAAPPLFSKFSELVKHIRLPFFQHNRRIVMGGLTHKKKLFLSISCIILVLLVVSIIFTKQKQEAAKNAALFQSTYQPAAKLYDEGKSLESLNPDLSQQDLQKAKQMLTDGQTKFPKDSPEEKQITDLLTKVQTELGSSSVANATPVKEATVGNNDLLTLEKANTDGTGFSQNGTTVYYVTPKEVIGISKSDGKKKSLVTNDSDWKQGVAIVPYQTNFYILDQQDGILKYVPTGNTYNKSAYFKSSSPDLTKAESMAIDSSIWILMKDGSIQKYTRGTADSFTIKGLSKPFNSPTKIYTNSDINNVYILDNGNSRIVKLANDGTFQQEYAASIIKNAKDFEVNESDKKILILSGDKIWEIDM